MIKTFTEDELLKYVYSEVSEEEKLEIDRVAKEDAGLKGKLNNLKELIGEIDQLTIKAPVRVVDRILYASKNFQCS